MDERADNQGGSWNAGTENPDPYRPSLPQVEHLLFYLHVNCLSPLIFHLTTILSLVEHSV